MKIPILIEVTELPLLPGELLPEGALEGAPPDDQQATVTGKDGAPEHVVRTVTENGQTLTFTNQAFERE